MGAVIDKKTIFAHQSSHADNKEIENVITDYKGLVTSIAKNYTSYNSPYEDLYQEGVLGLIRALEKFDVNLGCKFSTYATYWIKHYISRYVAKHGRLVRLPIKKNEVYRKIVKIRDILKLEDGEEPTFEKIASFAEMSVDDVKKILDVFQPELSFETPLGQSNADHYDIVEDKINSSPEYDYYTKEMRKELNRALDFLIDKERHILKLRFGIDVDDSVTLKDIADEYGISSETVRQIEKRAMMKIRSKFSHLAEYLVV